MFLHSCVPAFLCSCVPAFLCSCAHFSVLRQPTKNSISTFSQKQEYFSLFKKLKTPSMSAVFPLKSGRRDGDFNLNFLSKLAKLTCRCFLRSEIYVFAAFRFDEKRHPIRKVPPSPVSADSAPIFHSESEIGEEFSDSVTTRSVSDDVRKGSHDQAAIPILRTAVNCRELP